tara:strand:- start:208 stop:387 length:180 start_codon:yes stop_codon:yes gene_type:complete
MPLPWEEGCRSDFEENPRNLFFGLIIQSKVRGELKQITLSGVDYAERTNGEWFSTCREN